MGHTTPARTSRAPPFPSQVLTPVSSPQTIIRAPNNLSKCRNLVSILDMLLLILCEAADTVIAPKTRVQSTSSASLVREHISPVNTMTICQRRCIPRNRRCNDRRLHLKLMNIKASVPKGQMAFCLIQRTETVYDSHFP
jgi:hypothetical protein